MITYNDIKKNDAINSYIKKAHASLCALGHTEHSFPHVCRVAETARYILESLGFGEKDLELVQIAAYLHDIGNLINRVEHSQSGAVMAFRILDKLGMDAEDIATVVTAIGNHDEGTGVPVNPVAAALIIADKSDVRRTRVRNHDIASFDIHDRVNYSVVDAGFKVMDGKIAELKIEIDSKVSSIMDYFEIFLNRMLMCKKASETLGLSFRLLINGQQII